VLSSAINSDDEDNTCAGVGANNNTLYLINLIRTKRSLNRGLSVSHNVNGTWEAPQPLNLPVKIPALGFFSAYVAPDESIVIISAALQGSKGEEDLFICAKKPDGTWADLVHMGDRVNSAGYETTPFLAPDGKTLYFSSNGHGGLGDADIFRSQRQGDSWTSWSKPENMGPKVNTAGFDASFSVDANNNAYFTSGEGSKVGPGDIYGINIANMLPKDSSQAVPGTPAVSAPAATTPPAAVDSGAVVAGEPKVEKQDLASTETNTTGTNTAGTKTTGTKNSSTKSSSTKNAGPEVSGAEEASSADAANLPKAYFETNSADLGDEYRSEILSSVSSVLKGRTAYITIYGFADNVGDKAYNLSLSRRRAQAVKAALVASGIKSSRIKVKGFGEANPAADNGTDEGKKLNRRVEIHLSK
jgi:outer membrane protein OmpA-like peptidoglycan-associated protein